MTKRKELLHSYEPALRLSGMFQAAAWVLCFVNQGYGPAEVSGGVILNWRVWFISCGLFWGCFLGVFLTRRESPSVWRVLYTGLAFPALFVAAAVFVPRVYGAD